MNKITLSMATLAALMLVSFDGNVAQAAHGNRGFGLHIGGRNLHLDIGNPHGFQHRNHVVYRTQRVYQPSHRARYHYDWHDTSHWDYHPGGYVRHGNHVDYVPGHFDRHRQGHYDRHRNGHRNGYRRGHR